ncbi:hypothetical protein J2S47_000760 [Streptomyces griseoviridis]|uniref:Uncharacterized protein n=1 Tax=Streptomyces griseoviridis TaxID=45398 RepID=A0ABT9L979_STRGD|nr:hypothetical protein [Streptomyces griseoviridis]
MRHRPRPARDGPSPAGCRLHGLRTGVGCGGSRFPANQEGDPDGGGRRYRRAAHRGGEGDRASAPRSTGTGSCACRGAGSAGRAEGRAGRRRARSRTRRAVRPGRPGGGGADVQLARARRDGDAEGRPVEHDEERTAGRRQQRLPRLGRCGSRLSGTDAGTRTMGREARTAGGTASLRTGDLLESLWWHPAHERHPARTWPRHTASQAGRVWSSPRPRCARRAPVQGAPVATDAEPAPAVRAALLRRTPSTSCGSSTGRCRSGRLGSAAARPEHGPRRPARRRAARVSEGDVGKPAAPHQLPAPSTTSRSGAWGGGEQAAGQSRAYCEFPQTDGFVDVGTRSPRTRTAGPLTAGGLRPEGAGGPARRRSSVRRTGHRPAEALTARRLPHGERRRPVRLDQKLPFVMKGPHARVFSTYAPQWIGIVHVLVRQVFRGRTRIRHNQRGNHGRTRSRAGDAVE